MPHTLLILPKRSAFSSTMILTPISLSLMAASNPENPAPTMIAFQFSAPLDLNIIIFVSQSYLEAYLCWVAYNLFKSPKIEGKYAHILYLCIIILLLNAYCAF